MNIDIKIICEKCGKETPIDKEQSNENWIVYKTKCTCGGIVKPAIIEIKKKKSNK